MTRPTIDANIFQPSGTAGKAAIITDPANGFITAVITNLNAVSADLDTANIPATTGAVETVTTGALSLTIPYSYLSISATKAFSLADGTTVGQRKTIECSVAGSTPIGTLTIATPLSGEAAVHVFRVVGQALDLIWQTGGWHCTRKVRAGQFPVVVGTTVITGASALGVEDMCSEYKLSVTGTVHSTSTKGIPNGTVPGERIHIGVGTAAIIPVGDIAITGILKTTFAAATSLANLTDTTMSISLEWDGAAWCPFEFTAGSGTATFS